ncbi:Elicitin [Phytophthora megakarya]|uniref:Elicitin n=1 Tax=Phytophthora megakarya TaxID=4795 RepID=A0A225WW33_9STRA|nr:Elicitin [Phytophthora megakarya]
MQELTSINKAEVGSKTFALVDSYDCDNSMVATVRKFFKANDATFDTCIADSNYQLYPYTGIVPDAKTVTDLVNSNACMGIITAVVLLNMPPCILYDLAMRAACETILYYSVAMRQGVAAPTSTQFDELMTWRRHVNLAKAAGKPYDGKSKTYSEFTKYMGKAVTTSKVTVMDNFTVILDTEEADSIEMKDGKQPSFVSTNSSVDYFVGKVSAAENGVDDAPVTTASKTVTTQSSDATTLAITSTMTLAVLVLAVLV